MHDVYSVWNWQKGRYDYYRSTGPSRGYRTAIGYPFGATVPEDSVSPLPSDAEYVGEGDRAVGVVAASKKRNGLVFVAMALAGLWALS